MTHLRFERFMGMAPRLSDRLLADTAAASAQNARLLSGELRGIKTPERIHKFTTGTVKSAYRLYKDDDTAVWMGFASNDVDVVKAPLKNDSYNRHYWTGDQAFIAYNSDTRIENDDPPYRLGTPGPVTAPTLAVVGGSGATEDRAYVYTFVNVWGEESRPSPVVSESGFVDGSWNLSLLETSGSDMANRQDIDAKRIYRTVTGLSTVSYFFVAEIPIAQSTYSDTSTNAQVALNNSLQSFNWDLPEDDLVGLTGHPGGFLVAFKDRDLYFSERFRPHAWPTGYILSVEHPIVGLAIYGNMLAVLTKGHPVFYHGNRPDNMSPIKSQTAEPCLSKTSIASTLSGVLYASHNGLVLYNEGGPSVVTKPILTVEEWSTYSPQNLHAAVYGDQYIGYYSTIKAIKFSPSEPFGIFVELDRFDNVDNVMSDHTTGEMWLIRNNAVYKWEPPSGVPLYYRWLSKVFDFTRPLNFGAYAIKAEGETIEQSASDEALFTAYNAAILAADPPAALNPINFTPLNAKRTDTPIDVGTTPEGIDEIVQNRYPLGGSPLYDLEFMQSSLTQVTITIYADGRNILTRTVNPNQTYRIPSGFKAHTWQFELVGNSNVYSLAVAETPKELQNV